MFSKCKNCGKWRDGGLMQKTHDGKDCCDYGCASICAGGCGKYFFLKDMLAGWGNNNYCKPCYKKRYNN